MDFSLTESQVVTILAVLEIAAENTHASDLFMNICDAKTAVALQLREAIEKEMTNG